MSKFQVGQKVKIIQGGWGIHPRFVGRIVTIESVSSSGRYGLEETLIDGDVTQEGPNVYAHANSFAAVPVDATSEQIRSINAQIKEQDDILKAAQAEKARLNGKRQVLVAALLRELDV